MTTINVPRELLESACAAIKQRMCTGCEGVPCCMPDALDVLADIRTLLAEQPQAGHSAQDLNMAEKPQAGAGQAEPTICDDDSVLVPRGLIGAACYAIDKKADAPEVLKNLRSYRFVAAPQPQARHDQGDDTKRLDWMIEEGCVIYSMNGTASPTVYQVTWPRLGEHQREWYSTPRKAIDAALTHSKQGAKE